MRLKKMTTNWSDVDIQTALDDMDWKSALNLYVQKYPLASPRYTCNPMMDEDGLRIVKWEAECLCNRASGRGRGATKAVAEKHAARQCLFDLNMKRAAFNATKAGYPLVEVNEQLICRRMAIQYLKGESLSVCVEVLVSAYSQIFDEAAVPEPVRQELKAAAAEAKSTFAPVTSWSGKDVEQPFYGSKPCVQSNAGRAIRRINDLSKPNWTQCSLLLEEAFALDRANAQRQLRHMMESQFGLASLDGLLEWD